MEEAAFNHPVLDDVSTSNFERGNDDLTVIVRASWILSFFLFFFTRFFVIYKRMDV